MKTEIVSDRIFPSNRRVMVALIFEKWNIGHNPVVNFSQSHLTWRCALQCHCNQISVTTVTPGIFPEILSVSDRYLWSRRLIGILTETPSSHESHTWVSIVTLTWNISSVFQHKRWKIRAVANCGTDVKPYDGKPPHWKHELCDYGSSTKRYFVILIHR